MSKSNSQKTFPHPSVLTENAMKLHGLADDIKIGSKPAFSGMLLNLLAKIDQQYAHELKEEINFKVFESIKAKANEFEQKAKELKDGNN